LWKACKGFVTIDVDHRRLKEPSKDTKMTQTSRNKIFISHATPEDNNFAIWLASRLKSLGYIVWIDKQSLLGGEKFWQEIDRTIRHDASKVVLVYSKNICINGEPGQLRDGIEKEISLSDSVSKQNSLKDFLILMNIDGSAYNLFIGADRLNQITFYENWADGLKQLIEKFAKDKVYRELQNEASEFAAWYENEYITKSGIIHRKERYYTNIWPITELPAYFYLFQFETEREAQLVYKRPSDFPIAKISNVLSSFSEDVPLVFDSEGMTYTARLKGHFICNTRETVAGICKENDSFPTTRDSENHLKSLLTRVFHLLMKNRKMCWDTLANRKQAYYHTPASLHGGVVEFKHPSKKKKKKRKNIYGRYLSLGSWHYAVSCKPVLAPLLAYSLKSHIVFTTDGFNTWNDKKTMHRHRRAKGKRFFNAEWRDMQLAFLNSLRDDDKEIKMALNNSYTLYMRHVPVQYLSDFGYNEPNDKNRFDILNGFEKEDDEED